MFFVSISLTKLNWFLWQEKSNGSGGPRQRAEALAALSSAFSSSSMKASMVCFCLFNIGEALAFLFLYWLLYLLLLVHRLLKQVWYGLFCFNIGELLAFLFLCEGVRENMFILKWPCFIKENYCCQCCSVLYSKYSSFSFFLHYFGCFFGRLVSLF